MEECKTLMSRGILPKRQTRIQPFNEKRDKDAKSQSASTNTLYSDEVDDGIWLFDVLNTIGVNDEYRQASQQQGIIGEILETFPGYVTWYNMGSTIEGTATPGAQSDNDVIICDESFPVIEDISNAIRIDGVLFSLLIVRELDTADGYVKLQLVNGDIAYTSKHWTNLSRKYNMNLFKIDRMGRIVLSECVMKADPRLFKRTKNKPADLTIGKFSDLKIDTVLSYRGKFWPTMANEWLSRDRSYGWPNEETIEKLKSLGFFVVRKGHPFSPEIDLEWRISLSLQERILMFNLTDVQHKCYVILKMINREIINFDCITTYHWKTCLFYAIEENNLNIWKKNRLWYCIKRCIRLMLKWVKCGFCPNYFIPGENLFDGRLSSSWRLISEQNLEEILNVVFYSLLLVRKNNVCDYVKSRGSLVCLQRLQANSTKVFLQALCVARISIIHDAIKIFNYEILENNSCRAKQNTFIFINYIWLALNNIQHTCASISAEHTEREKTKSLSLLLPNIYTCVAGNISSIAIQNPNPKIRDFLLLGSFVYFMKGGLAGYLKFVSVLYAAELYNDCEWYINCHDEEYINYNPSVCMCRCVKIDQKLTAMNVLYTSPLQLSTCVSFLPTELIITPDAMKYEMFRYVGIPLDENERIDVYGRWNYRAVVDSNVYFFLLKYLINRKLGRVQECKKAIRNISNLLSGTNLRHRDVACNVLAWIFCSEFNTPEALFFSILSWKIMLSTDLCLMIAIDTMTQKQCLFNAAKIHALVILYNTWFANKPSSVHFCFQCFLSFKQLKKCSRCKLSAYCSKQCQIQNWKIHKAACKIARKYHND